MGQATGNHRRGVSEFSLPTKKNPDSCLPGLSELFEVFRDQKLR
jgi:hypothetical protein